MKLNKASIRKLERRHRRKKANRRELDLRPCPCQIGATIRLPEEAGGLIVNFEDERDATPEAIAVLEAESKSNCKRCGREGKTRFISPWRDEDGFEN